jgi:hypothetical protein
LKKLLAYRIAMEGQGIDHLQNLFANKIISDKIISLTKDALGEHRAFVKIRAG